jgi:Uma2 family endonuclease
LRLSRRASYAQYVSMERTSGWKHEFFDGVIVAMAGGSDEHNAIAGKFAAVLGTRVSGACRYYTPDQKYWIAATVRARYCDGSIICGPPEHVPHDGQASTNPVIVLEVLSPSSEGDDEGDKRIDFQSLATLKAYVLAHQDERCVRVYRRDDRGGWRPEPDVYRDGATFELPMLSTAVTVTEIYDGILDRDGRSLLHD